VAHRIEQLRDDLHDVSARRDTEKLVAREWEKKALLAIKAGRDDLAKQALERSHAHAAFAIEHDIEAHKLGLTIAALAAGGVEPRDIDVPRALRERLAAIRAIDLDAALAALKRPQDFSIQ